MPKRGRPRANDATTRRARQRRATIETRQSEVSESSGQCQQTEHLQQASTQFQESFSTQTPQTAGPYVYPPTQIPQTAPQQGSYFIPSYQVPQVTPQQGSYVTTLQPVPQTAPHMGSYVIPSTPTSQPPTAQGAMITPPFQTHYTATDNGSTIPMPQRDGHVVNVGNNGTPEVSQGRHQLINSQSNVSHAEQVAQTVSPTRNTVSAGANVSNTTAMPSQTPVILSRDVIDNEVSLVSVCDPVGAHVPLTIKEKIWKGEFIELATLLPDHNIKKRKDQSWELQKQGNSLIAQAKDPEKKEVKNINLWTTAFLIYIDILIEKHAKRVKELLKYTTVIRSFAENMAGSGWVEYDTKFRKKQERDPTRSWATIDMELYAGMLLYNTSPKPTFYGWPQDGVRNNFSFRRKTEGAACFDYNGGFCRFGVSRCRFSHKCNVCNKPGHPATKCFSNVQGGRQRMPPPGQRPDQRSKWAGKPNILPSKWRFGATTDGNRTNPNQLPNSK